MSIKYIILLTLINRRHYQFVEVILKPFTLKLKETFTIARDSYNTQETLIIELRDDKFSGYGEATAKAYYGITTQKMIDDIEKVKSKIESLNKLNPSNFWGELYPYFKENMFALCAIDIAYNDLFSRKQHKKLYDFWNLSRDNNPKSNYTIGIDSVEKMVGKLKETPWPIYKIKLGTKEDIKIITELRKHTNAIFRVDANCGWSVYETIANSFALKNLGVEFIEQPLKADDWNGHKEVFLKSELPIIADESCQVEDDIDRCHNHFHGVNVKLVKCGGLTPAKRMLLKAKQLKMKTMVGCMTESSIGISAIAHLLPLLDYVDMDGALLLTNDIAKGVTIDKGIVSYSKLNGIGTTLTKI